MHATRSPQRCQSSAFPARDAQMETMPGKGSQPKIASSRESVDKPIKLLVFHKTGHGTTQAEHA
jgi:hypothetical protein